MLDEPMSEIKPHPQAKLEYMICSFVSMRHKSMGVTVPLTNEMEELKTGVSSFWTPVK